jgi:heptosyltransferase-1
MSAGSTEPPIPAPERVLIILLGSIGDVVRALPLLGRMRKTWPAARLAWAVEPKSAPILRGHPWLNELIVYDRKRPWSFPLFLNKIRRGRFDLVLDLQRHLKSGISSIISGANRRWGFAPSNVKEFNHWFSTHHIPAQAPMKLKLEQYQAFGEALALDPMPAGFGLDPATAARDRVRRLIGDIPRPRLGVILASSWPSRVYFAQSVAAVIRNLAAPANALSPILIGGPDDLAMAAEVERELGSTPHLNLAGQTQLDDLPAVFTECDVAFGPDSGPMHIAAAVGCPVVSLWGATAAQRSAPWNSQAFTITADIPCSPCYLRRCPIGRECMRRIAPENVAAMVKRALAEHPRLINHRALDPEAIGAAKMAG